MKNLSIPNNLINFDKLQTGLVSSPEPLLGAETIQVILAREIHDFTVLRTEPTRELNTVVTPTSITEMSPLLRVIFLASKQKAVESRALRSILKTAKSSLGLQDTECYLKANLCMSCPRCVLFGAVKTEKGKQEAIKHRVGYGSAFSLMPYEDIEAAFTFNAVDEKTNDPYKKTWDRNRGHIRELKRKRHGNCKDPVKRLYKIWTEDEDKLLTLSYAKTTDAELQELFPDRTKDSIDQRAYRLGIVKSPEIRAQILSANANKHGIANFADYPVEALAKKYPDLKQAYDAIMERLLCHPSVNPNDVLQVELLKEAALHKVTQFMLMKDRIDNDLKGKTLMFNPKNGMEHWVESRYPHSPDITNDSKMARQILKDLGIIEEKERKVDVTAHLKMLWEEEPTDDQEEKPEKKVSKSEPEAE